jgi:Rod binding domain-containing protein
MSDPVSTGPASPAARAAQLAPKLKATAQEFEAVFLGQMVKIMMEAGKPEGEFTGGGGEEMFRGVLAEKLGSEMAKRGGVGLQPMVLDQMIKMQEQEP